MRSEQEVIDRIEEIRGYNHYAGGPSGRDERYKDQGKIDALRWVLSGDE